MVFKIDISLLRLMLIFPTRPIWNRGNYTKLRGNEEDNSAESDM
jgi:hypothetical protein